MSNIDVIRAWKDEEYRMGLSDDERALLPDNPAGLVEFVDRQAAADDSLVTFCPEQSVDMSCITYCPYTVIATNCIHVCPLSAVVN